MSYRTTAPLLYYIHNHKSHIQRRTHRSFWRTFYQNLLFYLVEYDPLSIGSPLCFKEGNKLFQINYYIIGCVQNELFGLLHV